MWQSVLRHCHVAIVLKHCYVARFDRVCGGDWIMGVRCREILNSIHYFSANLILKLKLKSWNRWFTLSDDSPCLFVCFLQTYGQTRENAKIPVFSKFFGCTTAGPFDHLLADVKLWHYLSHNVQIFVTSAYHIASDETKWRLTFVMGGKKAILVWMHVEAEFWEAVWPSQADVWPQ